MLSELPLLLVSKYVLRKLSLIQLVLLSIAYVNGAIQEEIRRTIQKKLARFQESILYVWAEHIADCLAKQYEILFQQMETGKPIGLWKMSLKFGEHNVVLNGSYKKHIGLYAPAVLKPNIRFMVYKTPADANPADHFHFHIDKEHLIANKWYCDNRIGPDLWKKKAKKYIFTALKAEYGRADLSGYVRAADVRGFLEAYKQHIHRDYSAEMTIGIASEDCDGCDEWYNEFYDTKNNKGYDPVKYMKKNYRGKKPQQAWMKRLVIPMSEKSKRLVEDLAKPFREPEFLWAN